MEIITLSIVVLNLLNMMILSDCLLMMMKILEIIRFEDHLRGLFDLVEVNLGGREMVELNLDVELS